MPQLDNAAFPKHPEEEETSSNINTKLRVIDVRKSSLFPDEVINAKAYI